MIIESLVFAFVIFCIIMILFIYFNNEKEYLDIIKNNVTIRFYKQEIDPNYPEINKTQLIKMVDYIEERYNQALKFFDENIKIKIFLIFSNNQLIHYSKYGKITWSEYIQKRKENYYDKINKNIKTMYGSSSRSTGYMYIFIDDNWKKTLDHELIHYVGDIPNSNHFEMHPPIFNKMLNDFKNQNDN